METKTSKYRIDARSFWMASTHLGPYKNVQWHFIGHTSQSHYKTSQRILKRTWILYVCCVRHLPHLHSIHRSIWCFILCCAVLCILCSVFSVLRCHSVPLWCMLGYFIKCESLWCVLWCCCCVIRVLNILLYHTVSVLVASSLPAPFHNLELCVCLYSFLFPSLVLLFHQLLSKRYILQYTIYTNMYLYAYDDNTMYFAIQINRVNVTKIPSRKRQQYRWGSGYNFV